MVLHNQRHRHCIRIYRLHMATVIVLIYANNTRIKSLSDAPPSYESLYGEFREVQDPKTFASVFIKTLNFIIGTAVATVILALINIIPISMIVIGGLNINNCPAQPYIPIWLVVMGSVSIFKSLLNCLYRAKRYREGSTGTNNENIKPNPCDGLISCFLVGWFIAGNVWVYTAWNTTSPDPQPTTPSHYCNQLTITLAYWVITLTYILLAAFMIGTCCCGCCAICFGRRRRHEDDPA